MSASLVGSEMCIRDSPAPRTLDKVARVVGRAGGAGHRRALPRRVRARACLLYTSDAADDM
eukprot:5637286-Alexandrium_andersonii.AAC.1